MTPTSRIRAGNGPARRLEIAKTSDSQPASSSRPSSRMAGLKRSMWPTWTGGAPGAVAAATIRSASAGVAASGFSMRTAMPRSSAARASGRCVGGRGRDDDRVEVRLGQHGERLGERLGAGPGGGRAEGLCVEVGDGDQTHVGQAAEDAQMVAAHRAETDQPDAQLALADRGPGGGHRAAARSGARWTAAARRR